jgi:Rrf2 family protein
VRLTKTSEYAIRALTFMTCSPLALHSVMSLHERLEIPYKYLGRLMHDLAQKGLLEAVRGKNGGYRIHGDPARIRLRDIVEAVEGMEAYEACILGFPSCGDENPCPLHRYWKEHKVGILEMLDKVSLADLAQGRACGEGGA